MGSVMAETPRTYSRRGWSTMAFLIGAVLLSATCGPPTSEEIAGWDASDESNTASIDHGAWQDILDAYVEPDPDGVNLIDYAGMEADTADAEKLAAYLDGLEALDPRDYSRAEQMAYWINFYNALTVKVVLDAYPVDSIKDIHVGVIPLTGPWGDVHANVAGQDLTLDQIEHGILRPIWQDPRIHYAVNCAAYGCPHLLETAFTAGNTEALLDAGARDYVNNFRGVDVVDEDFIVLSSIYEWYTEDFGNTEELVLAHLRKYAADDLAAFLESFDGAIEYDYNWDLNEPAK